MRTLFRIEGVAATVDFGHIKRHCYQSHRNLNPSDIVPVGPELAFMSRASADGLAVQVGDSFKQDK
jgi:putative glutathione S-transferase